MSLRIGRTQGKGIPPIKGVYRSKGTDNRTKKEDNESKNENRDKVERRKDFFECLQEKAKEVNMQNNSYNKVHKKADLSNKDRGGR